MGRLEFGHVCKLGGFTELKIKYWYCKEVKKILLTLLLSSICLSSYAFDGLSSALIPRDYVGIISSDHFSKIKDLLESVDEDEILKKALERSQFSNYNELRQIISVCTIEEQNTLGHYTSGEENIYYTTRKFEEVDQGIQISTNIQKYIDKAYKSKIIEEIRYNKVIVKAAPKVCLRGGRTLLSTALTLVHELSHFVYDNEHIESLNHHSTSEDYINSKIYDEGGEVNAYLLSAKLSLAIEEKYGVQSSQKLLDVITDINAVDTLGLEKYILDDLGYRSKLSDQYAKSEERRQEEIISEQNRLLDFQVVYFENYRINKSNIEIMKSNIAGHNKQLASIAKYILELRSNIKIFKSNLKLIEKSPARFSQSDKDNQLNSLKKTNENIAKAQEQVVLSRAAIKKARNELTVFEQRDEFYTEIIKLY